MRNEVPLLGTAAQLLLSRWCCVCMVMLRCYPLCWLGTARIGPERFAHRLELVLPGQDKDTAPWASVRTSFIFVLCLLVFWGLDDPWPWGREI